MCDQKETGSEGRAVEEDLRFGLGIGLFAEVEELAVWAAAAAWGNSWPQ